MNAMMRTLEIQKVILIVDDDETYALTLIGEIAQQRPYRVLHASNGYAALKFTRYFRPHLFIITDRLSRMSGLELYDKLHLHKPLQDIPVLMISGGLVCSEMRKRQIVALGRPFEVCELLQKIDLLLNECRPP